MKKRRGKRKWNKNKKKKSWEKERTENSIREWKSEIERKGESVCEKTFQRRERW